MRGIFSDPNRFPCHNSTAVRCLVGGGSKKKKSDGRFLEAKGNTTGAGGSLCGNTGSFVRIFSPAGHQ